MDPHDLALAYALSTVAGLRASMTLLALTFAAHFHAATPPAGLAWVGRDDVFAIALVLTIAESIADKVPVVDHALHALHAALGPLVGAVAVGTVDPQAGAALPLFASVGAANAFGVTALRSTARLGSTMTTAGMLNPVVSFVEDGLSVLGLVAAFFAPVACAAVALVVTVIVVRTALRIRRKRRAARIAAA